jgi:hypothetical protein
MPSLKKKQEFRVCGFVCTDTSGDNKKIGRLHVACVICQWYRLTAKKWLPLQIWHQYKVDSFTSNSQVGVTAIRKTNKTSSSSKFANILTNSKYYVTSNGHRSIPFLNGSLEGLAQGDWLTYLMSPSFSIFNPNFFPQWNQTPNPSL